jgi:hypothetical protein
MVEDRGLGLTVPQRDVNALATAIIRMRDDPELRKRYQAAEATLAPELSWSRCLAPLIDFCREMPEPSTSRSTAHTALLAASYFASRGDLFVRDGSLERTVSRLTTQVRQRLSPSNA